MLTTVRPSANASDPAGSEAGPRQGSLKEKGLRPLPPIPGIGGPNPSSPSGVIGGTGRHPAFTGCRVSPRCGQGSEGPHNQKVDRGAWTSLFDSSCQDTGLRLHTSDSPGTPLKAGVSRYRGCCLSLLSLVRKGCGPARLGLDSANSRQRAVGLLPDGVTIENILHDDFRHAVARAVLSSLRRQAHLKRTLVL